MADDFMKLPPSALEYAQTIARKRGHAGYPGRGPKGETCGSCVSYTHNDGRTAKSYRKCELNRKNWTGGPGSDVRMRDPACEFWKAKEAP